MTGVLVLLGLWAAVTALALAALGLVALKDRIRAHVDAAALRAELDDEERVKEWMGA